MRRFAYLWVLFSLVSGSLSAQSQEARFTSAAPSPLKRSVFIAPNETRFSGSAQITGRFELIREPGGEGLAGVSRVMFKPDADSRRVLPHEVATGPVRKLWIRNTDEAISALLPPAQRKDLSSGARKLTGTATIVIRSYRSAADCDQRGYDALFVSLVGAPGDAVAVSDVDEVSTC
ncbi:hypothetical protein ARC20_08405 [Stenotrophomonas panacihumi]|uniref:Uncharacterized protein n=1 Tax=Stenotrophomonas panacihumi TaxID=676599 RepID=A0A0R0ARU3_9GAMM|nr:hypothetical protein [Stenotrophomonas panacihumi]KRG44430.1 hypothetical protein ARC20_08405 [Stenotrophomonas panacihumi]PTN54566.1 hypothetical protein C9J98_10025 [Stenotrophomonas panacihumi]